MPVGGHRARWSPLLPRQAFPRPSHRFDDDGVTLDQSHGSMASDICATEAWAEPEIGPDQLNGREAQAVTWVASPSGTDAEGKLLQRGAIWV